MSTRKTLKEFFQSKGSVQSEISFPHEDSNANGKIEQGDDIGVDPESGEKLLDVEDSTTGLIGDYVNFLMSSYDHKTGTFNSKISNFYRPGPKNTRSPSNDRGNLVHNPSGPDGSAKVFAGSDTQLGATLGRYSNSGYISNLDSIVKKEGDFQNHEILAIEKEKIKNKGSTFNNQETSEVVIGEPLNTLKGNNRYYPGKFNQQGVAYAEKGETDSLTIDDTDLHIYDTLGENEENDMKIKISNLFSLVPDLLKTYTGINPNDLAGKTEEEVFEIITNSEYKKTSSKDLKASLQDSVPDSIKNSGYHQSKGDTLRDERSIEVQKADFSDYSYENPDYLISLGAVRLKIITTLILDYFQTNSVKNKQRSKLILQNRGRSPVPFFADTFYPILDCIDEGLSVLFSNNISISDFNAKLGTEFSSIKDSKLYWIPFFKAIIHESENIVNKIENETTKEFLSSMKSSKIASFVNILAYIGDMSLRSTRGKGVLLEKDLEEIVENTTNVDLLPDTLGNIVSKNKTKSGKMSWRQGSTPSLFMIPGNVSRAAFLLGSGFKGANPLKSVLSENLSGQTIVSPAEGDFARLPSAIVEKLENELEASYMPFYFHDLRTNEIISFHAFLESLSDGFTPQVNPSSGYGRMDPVQIYKGTTRSISVTFKVAATSKKDFNEMWWKINKLVTLAYPKWSKGTEVFDKDGGNKFIQPYSQVISASPMIRMRVGDIIKSNYSELNLARQFGIGDYTTKVNGRAGTTLVPSSPGKSKFTETVNVIKLIADLSTKVAFGSPVAWAQLGSNLVELSLRTIGTLGTDIAATIAFDSRLYNYGEKAVINSVNTQNSIGYKILYKKFEDPNDNNNDLSYGFQKSDKVIIAASLPDFPYYSRKSKKYIHIKRSLTGEIKSSFFSDKENKVLYRVKIVDIDASSRVINKEIIARHEDLILSPEHMFLGALASISENVANFFASESAFASEEFANDLNKLGYNGDDINPFKLFLPESNFMSPFARIDGGLTNLGALKSGEMKIPTGNPFTRAYNSAKGRGLAGFISNLSFELLGESTTWETDFNSRAPKIVTVTLSFNPVHDLAPGLDHSGFNRAPVYNVGDIMRYTSGDPWDSAGTLSEKSYKSDAKPRLSNYNKKEK